MQSLDSYEAVEKVKQTCPYVPYRLLDLFIM